MILASTIKRRLSILNQGEGPVPAPSPVFVSMVTVPAMAAVPGTSQGDMDPDVESPVAWGQAAKWLKADQLPCSCVLVCVCMCVCLRSLMAHDHGLCYSVKLYIHQNHAFLLQYIFCINDVMKCIALTDNM